MPLDATRAAEKTGAIAGDFLSIGHVDGSAMPATPRSTDPDLQSARKAAWEYHIASALLRLAESRRGKAITAAVKTGVLFDHKAKPLPAGSSRVVYADPNVEITVRVGDSGRAGVDHDGFVASLIRAKVDPKLLDRLAKKHRTETAPSHTFTSSLVTK